MRVRFLILTVIIVILMVPAICQVFHMNKGESRSTGSYNNGSLENGYLLPRKGENYHCYSALSYYILDREYVHSKVYRTIVDSYEELYRRHPERKYVYMESARRKGGRLYPHRTHQNGLSVDFMSPLLKNKTRPKYYNGLGAWRYNMNFNDSGTKYSNHGISIDFNAMAEHILILEKIARQNGIRIKKVIFKVSLKDNLYKTPYGRQLKSSGIYFAQNLSPLLNKVHDDHYHVDFELID